MVSLRSPLGIASTSGGGGLTALVWYTSLMVKFIKLSHAVRCPLSVSPFLSSTSCSGPPCRCRQFVWWGERGRSGRVTDHGLVLRRVQEREGKLDGGGESATGRRCFQAWSSSPCLLNDGELERSEDSSRPNRNDGRFTRRRATSDDDEILLSLSLFFRVSWYTGEKCQKVYNASGR